VAGAIAAAVALGLADAVAAGTVAAVALGLADAVAAGTVAAGFSGAADFVLVCRDGVLAGAAGEADARGRCAGDVAGFGPAGVAGAEDGSLDAPADAGCADAGAGCADAGACGVGPEHAVDCTR